MLNTLKASLVYFALVLATGFCLGVLRVPFLVPRIGERWAELAADQEPLDRSLATLGTGLVAAFMSTVTYDVVQILQVAGMLRFPADEILILIYLLLADRAVKIVADRGIYSKVWAAPSPVDTAFSLSVPPFRSRLNSDNPM